MTARKKKFKKRSGTNSWQPSSSLVLFLDENTTSSQVVTALREIGFKVEVHRDHFKPGTSDPEWLTALAKYGWTAISRDKRLRYRPNEIQTIRATQARVVIVTGGNLSAGDLAKLLRKFAKKLSSFLEGNPGQLLATFTQSGAITKHHQ